MLVLVLTSHNQTACPRTANSSAPSCSSANPQCLSHVSSTKANYLLVTSSLFQSLRFIDVKPFVSTPPRIKSSTSCTSTYIVPLPPTNPATRTARKNSRPCHLSLHLLHTYLHTFIALLRSTFTIARSSTLLKSNT